MAVIGSDLRLFVREQSDMTVDGGKDKEEHQGSGKGQNVENTSQYPSQDAALRWWPFSAEAQPAQPHRGQNAWYVCFTKAGQLLHANSLGRLHHFLGRDRREQRSNSRNVSTRSRNCRRSCCSTSERCNKGLAPLERIQMMSYGGGISTKMELAC